MADITDTSFFHGAALHRIIREEEYKALNVMPDFFSRSAYLLNHDTSLYIRHSALDEGPWGFVLTPEQQEEIRKLFDKYGDRSFYIFVCGGTGICISNFHVLSNCIDWNFQRNITLTIYRRSGGGFRLKSVREYNRVIPLNRFPKQIFE